MDDFSELTGAALVVGGSGGIGRTVVRLLAQRGSDVALTWRHGRGGRRRPAQRGGLLRRPGQHAPAGRDRPGRVRSGWSREVIERHGGVHTLVHAAGPHVPMVHLSNVDPAAMTGQLA